MFNKIIKKPLKIIWSAKDFYLPFMVGTLIAFSTLISVVLLV